MSKKIIYADFTPGSESQPSKNQPFQSDKPLKRQEVRQVERQEILRSFFTELSKLVLLVGLDEYLPYSQINYKIDRETEQKIEEIKRFVFKNNLFVLSHWSSENFLQGILWSLWNAFVYVYRNENFDDPMLTMLSHAANLLYGYIHQLSDNDASCTLHPSLEETYQILILNYGDVAIQALRNHILPSKES